MLAITESYCQPQHEWSCEQRMQLSVPVDLVGRGAAWEFRYKSEEKPEDSRWARWIPADLRDGQAEHIHWDGDASNDHKAAEKDTVGRACM